MRTTLVTKLLVGLALGLAALCSFQWLRETENRRDVQEQVSRLQSHAQQNTNRIHQLDLQVSELTEEALSLRTALQTHKQSLIDLGQDRTALEASNRFLAAQLEAYTNAFAQVTNQLNQAHDNIKTQNKLIEEAIAQRDDYARKLNASIRERNEVVDEFNALVRKIEESRTQTPGLNPANR
jgi:chromosome segregation ATPase